MTVAIWAAAIICGLAIAFQLGSIVIAIVRCRLPARHLAPSADAPPITIIRPVCGLDNFVDATLRSTFTLDYPRYEILFCAASTRDPVVGLVQSLIAEHPHVSAKLLIGDERISANPKLNNVLKGWHAAANERIVMADSNVLLPRDYLQRLLATWQGDTGMVSAPPIGSHPSGFWAQMECVFLNTYQARWQYVADTVGLGFAQGKTLFYRRGETRAAGRCAVRAAARRTRARPRMGPAGPLGEAAARQLPVLLLPRDRRRNRAAARRRHLPCNRHRSFGHRRKRAFARGLVRRGNDAGGGRRLAPAPPLPVARDAARPDAAGVVVRGLARGRLRLARQRHERRRRRSGQTGLG
jgi:hypothetical protein